MNCSKKIVVFVLGGPGSGKGTQCDLIKNKFKFTHLSAGELLREERNTPGTQYGEIIQQRCNEGKIVPSQITVSLLERAMSKDQSERFLIDGFPRNLENYEVWEKIVPHEQVELSFVLFLDCSEQTLEKRLGVRRESSGRQDDKEEVMRKRFKTFRQETMPIVEIYRKQGKLLEVSSEGSVEEVFSRLEKSFQKLA